MQPPVTCEAGKYVRAEFKHFVISKKKKKKRVSFGTNRTAAVVLQDGNKLFSHFHNKEKVKVALQAGQKWDMIIPFHIKLLLT